VAAREQLVVAGSLLAILLAGCSTPRHHGGLRVAARGVVLWPFRCWRTGWRAAPPRLRLGGLPPRDTKAAARTDPAAALW